MKREEIVIGRFYAAKGHAIVKILFNVWGHSDDCHVGWDAVDVETGQNVRIKTARRLRREVCRVCNSRIDKLKNPSVTGMCALCGEMSLHSPTERKAVEK